MIALAADFLVQFFPLIVGFIALVFIRPLVSAMQAAIGGIPLVGGAIANSLNGLWSFFDGLVTGIERSVEYAANQILQVVGNVAIAIVKPVTDYLHHLISQLLSDYNWAAAEISILWTQVFGFLADKVNGLLTMVAHFSIDIAGLHTSLADIVNRVSAGAVTLEWIVAKAIPGLSDRLGQLEHKAQAYDAMVAEYAQTRVLVAEHSASIAKLNAAVVSIDANIGIDGRRIGTLADSLTQVLPLSVIAALGATAITNLMDLAQDPCFCMSPLGGLNDIPGRILALENSQ